MSEPEAKQYLLDSIEHCREALSAIGSASNSGLDVQRKTLEEVLKLLEGLTEKVFFKTKKAMTPAFMVLEASQVVSDQAEEIDGADEDVLKEFDDAVNQLKDNAVNLEASSKKQSIIVT